MSGKQEEKMIQKVIAKILDNVQKKNDKQTRIFPSIPTLLSRSFLCSVVICQAFDIMVKIGLT